MTSSLAVLALFGSVVVNLLLGLVVVLLVRSATAERARVGGATRAGSGDAHAAMARTSRRDAIVELQRRGVPARAIASALGASRGEIELALKLSGRGEESAA